MRRILWVFSLWMGIGIPGIGQTMRGDLIDVSEAFQRLDPVYFIPARVETFDPVTGAGQLRWERYGRQPSLSFNKIDRPLVRVQSTEFPATEYDRDPVLPFTIEPVSARSLRLRFLTRPTEPDNTPSLMLAGPVPRDMRWQVQQTDSLITLISPAGYQVRLYRDPWRIAFYDPKGRLLTRTMTLDEPATFAFDRVPFCYIRRSEDLSHWTAATFELAYDEKIFGTGESFTRLNKRGQKIIAFLRDGMGTQGQRMYKPIPFFLSSQGYGVFVHTSTPVTFDFGHTFDQFNTIYTGDETLDLFFFFGTPKQILSEYTALTGRSPVPPLWSFGLWMSRITYDSEQQVREVAAKLRQHRIPADVIHLDTGWFETDWRNDYRFSSSRFIDPVKMIADLKAQGFHISLWQLPYFSAKNSLYAEIVAKGLHVRSENGRLPFEDAILDFSNPEAVAWYQEKLAELLRMGVGAIKVDFGEDAPVNGIYASGRTGWYEHNLYPLRYNRAAAEITRHITGEAIIWARSAWAGSQRYPLHWGGDAENTNSAMAATLRGGLSFGLSGFTYWSHDVGGFVAQPSVDLYRRWLAFGVLTSHTRCHGAPPREPWAYGETFIDDFRRAVELKYRLMPYIYAQAVRSSAEGHPMLRTLFFEFPEDPTSWLIEDQYLLGEALLVAPLFEDGAKGRQVYVPPGTWIDYQTGRVYEGARWHWIEAGPVPIIVLVRDHTVLPHIELAQSTMTMDWRRVSLHVFSTDGKAATGWVALPGQEAQALTVKVDAQRPVLQDDPFEGRVQWMFQVATGQGRK
jgi:alpha-D-xyloside xylohydrolase